MPLGAAAKSTINIDFTRAQGTNSSGKILFAPPRVVVGTTVLSTRAVVANISDGVGTIDLVRLPAGTYHVTEMIDGTEPYEWDFALPTSAPASIEYETIAAVSPVPAIFTYVRTVNGVPPDPVTGNIEIAGGGGPSTLDSLTDVTIVTPANGQSVVYDSADSRWENRALTAADVGASPTGHTHTAAQITDFLTAVDARVQLIVDAAPAALDTLNELAAALGDDPNFAGTITLSLAGKQPLDSDLTAIAGLVPADSDLIQRISGAWANRTPAQVKASLGLGNVTDNAQVPLSLFDAAGDLLVGSGDNTAVRLPKGTENQILKVVSGALAYADPAFDPGDDILALYGYHSCTAPIDTFDSVFNQNNELWQGTVTVRAGRPINKIATFVNVAGTSAGAGTNGFAITSEDGQALIFSVDDDTLWETDGLREKLLGGSAVPPQTTDRIYRVQLCVQNYSPAPEMLLSVTNRAVLSNHNGRSRFQGGVGFQSGAGYNPVTFGGTTSGASPLIMIG